MVRAALLIFACLLTLSQQKSTVDDDSYVAAVVEYEVNSDVSINLENYLKLIKDAADQNADIVVFPEMTLTRGQRHVLIPIHGQLKQFPVPALRPDLYDEILVEISKAALEHQIYVVINVQEVVDCNDAPDEYCPERKEYLFNTNVVFDRTGAVIDRYRKINLFGEFTRTAALRPELGLFATDFGVTFGHFICFDLMFQVPAVQVVEKHNLTNIIFTTMWFSEMPYLTAAQIQQAYAHAMNVNLLASGANNVRVGSAGSGIYSGRAGTLMSVMPGVPTTRLLVSKVPKTPGEVKEPYPGPLSDDPKSLDNLVLISDPSLPSHVSRPLVEGSQEFTLTTKDVSCKFKVKLRSHNGDGQQKPHYRALAKDGINTYSRRDLGVAACSVVACENDTIQSCPYRFNKINADVEIEELDIEMLTHRLHFNTTLQCDDIVYFPISFRNNKFPLSPENFTFVVASKVATEDGSCSDNLMDSTVKEHVSYGLKAPQTDLVSFGVWGRIFNRDVNHNKQPTAEDLENYLEIEDWIYKKGKNDEKIMKPNEF